MCALAGCTPCRSCFLPRTPNTNLSSWQSGAGFALSSSPRVPASPIAAASGGGSGGSAHGSLTGHSRHPAASHRIVVTNPGNTEHPLSVLSQSDVLRCGTQHLLYQAPCHACIVQQQCQAICQQHYLYMYSFCCDAVQCTRLVACLPAADAAAAVLCWLHPAMRAGSLPRTTSACARWARPAWLSWGWPLAACTWLRGRQGQVGQERARGQGSCTSSAQQC
jgi:hypothetical protein